MEGDRVGERLPLDGNNLLVHRAPAAAAFTLLYSIFVLVFRAPQVVGCAAALGCVGRAPTARDFFHFFRVYVAALVASRIVFFSDQHRSSAIWFKALFLTSVQWTRLGGFFLLLLFQFFLVKYLAVAMLLHWRWSCD